MVWKYKKKEDKKAKPKKTGLWKSKTSKSTKKK